MSLAELSVLSELLLVGSRVNRIGSTLFARVSRIRNLNQAASILIVGSVCSLLRRFWRNASSFSFKYFWWEREPSKRKIV